MKKPGAFAVALLVFSTSAVAQQQLEGTWQSITNIRSRADMVMVGTLRDGEAQYLCRTTFGGSIYTGYMSARSQACHVGVNHRELTPTTFEVLAAAPVSDRARLDASHTVIAGAQSPGRRASRDAGRAAAQAQTAPTVQLQTSTYCAGVDRSSPTNGALATHARFDDQGPFIDADYPDGVVRRIREWNITVFKGGQQVAVCFNLQFAHAPSPTQPELPTDPIPTPEWVERHNAELLQVIRELVHQDESVMNALSSKEQRDVGNDLSKQIAYRTGVVFFYVTHPT